jgi:hypothetical protein
LIPLQVDLWFASGIVATLFAKVIAANFAICLLRYTDPLSKCNGMYECPPDFKKVAHLIDADMNHMRNEKIGVLKSAAARGVLIWGALFQAVLTIIIRAGASIGGDGLDSDSIVGGLLIFIALMVIPAVGCYLAWVARHPRRDDQPKELTVFADIEHI